MSVFVPTTTTPTVGADPLSLAGVTQAGSTQARAERRLALRHLALCGVLAFSAVLNIRRLSQNGFANIFYSAGVKSMLLSLHNFLFVSFDPGGLMTIDKPPLGLWLQVGSAKLFGFSPLSLLLPEAIAGVLAVGALYWAMTRSFGPLAALAGALALAVFPSFVAVSRDNDMDALLILLMVLACGMGLRAIEDGRWRTLLGCALLVGLAFNTKTLAAYLIVPGISVAYLIGAPGTLARRLLRLLVAGLVLAVVSFAWIAFVDLTPASQRPFVGGSLDNSELGLTFDYNGFGRVGGQVGGPGQIPVAPGAASRAVHQVRSTVGTGRAPAPQAPAPVKPVLSPVLPDGRDRHPTAFGGPTGPLRLFESGLGDQGGWMLPFAVLGLLAIALTAWRASRSTSTAASESASAPDDVHRGRRDPRLAGLLVLGGWFVVEATVLSLSKGIVHPYYVSALGPGTAAMVGGGAVAFTAFARKRDWRSALIPLALAGTVIVQLILLRRAHYMHWFEPVLIAGAAISLLGLAVRRMAIPAMVGTLGLLLLAPGVYAASTWGAPVQGTFPAAGPTQAAGPGGLGVTAAGLRTNRALADYVSTHHPTRRWALLTDASDTAAPLILLGFHAAALGGYSGTDPALDGHGLARLVSRGEARYVLLGGAYATRGGNRATTAVRQACRRIKARSWLPGAKSEGDLFLEDCHGRETQLAAADARSGTGAEPPARAHPLKDHPATGRPRTLRRPRVRGGRRARTIRSHDQRPSVVQPIRRHRAAAARHRRSAA